jgi:hypothetical protein
MTPGKHLLLRIYVLTVGRFPLFSRLLRRIMVTFLIEKKKDDPYVPSSRFFDFSEFD